MPPPTRAKPIARRTVLSRRDALTADERAVASAKIAARATTLVTTLLRTGSVLALYACKDSEVDPAAIDLAARAAGIRVVYPRIVDGDRQLAFHDVELAELVTGRFGLREPPPDAPTFAIDEIDAFVVPGLAFDRAGGRIGWGRGHYDATLSAAPSARRIGLAFECQMIEHVPHDPHDAVLHDVVTEVAIYRTPD